MKVFSDIDAEAAEDQRSRIGGSRALGVEIHFLAGEILQALDFGPNKDMQLRGKEIEQVGDPAPDLRYLNLVLLERVGIDDRRIDAAQIEQRVQIFGGAPGDDRQDMQIRPVVDDAGHLGREAKRRALEQAAGEADGPGVHLLFFVSLTGRVAPRALCVCASSIGWSAARRMIGANTRARANDDLETCQLISSA